MMKINLFTKKLLAVAVISVCGVLFSGDTSFAATITVNTAATTSTADGTAHPGECSLHDALSAAATDSAVAGCAAGDLIAIADDIIVLPEGTFTIKSGHEVDHVSFKGVSPEKTKLVSEQSIYYSCTDGVTRRQRFVMENLTVKSKHAINLLRYGCYAIDNREWIDGIEHRVVSTNAPVADFLFNNVIFEETNLYILNGGYTGQAFNWLVGDLAYGGAQRMKYNLPDTMLNVKDIKGINSKITVGYIKKANIENIDMDGVAKRKYEIWSAVQTLGPGRTTIKNARIRNYNSGLVNAECIPYSSSMYVNNTNVSNVDKGVYNLCGHVNIQNSTFNNIQDQAVKAGFDNPKTWFNDFYSSISVNTEIYNSTFTDVRGSNGKGVVDVSTMIGDSYTGTALGMDWVPADKDRPTLDLRHNTFYGNSAAHLLTITKDPCDEGDSVVQCFIKHKVIKMKLRQVAVKNNAIDVVPLKEELKSDVVDFSGNMILKDYDGFGASGFKKVADFKLGELRDNGGYDSIGYMGQGGNLMTFRPLKGSPLIDGAASAELDRDQRNVSRSKIGAYDVGAVEVTAEEIAEGSTSTPQNNESSQKQPGSVEPNLAQTGDNGVIIMFMSIISLSMGLIIFFYHRS